MPLYDAFAVRAAFLRRTNNSKHYLKSTHDKLLKTISIVPSEQFTRLHLLTLVVTMPHKKIASAQQSRHIVIIDLGTTHTHAYLLFDNGFHICI